MSEYYNIVPWCNSSEWHNVYKLIYIPMSSILHKQEALNQLLVWKARCPSLPSGIESTLTLLEVHIQDVKNVDDSLTDQFLRLAYSAAIMRFVNHMLDSEIAKGTSLYQAAKSLGVPDWIVDLRHNTAHSNNLPCIGILREACAIGLDWLKQHYWDKHKLHIKDYLSGQNFSSIENNKVSTFMNFCVSISFCAHSNCKIKNLASIPDTVLKESIVNDIKYLFGDSVDLSNLKTVSVTALINTMNVHSKKIFKAKDSIRHMNKALLGEDSLLLSLDLVHFMGGNYFKNYKKLNKDYVQCFEVLLTFLHTNDLILDFILELIKVTQVNDSSDGKCLLAALWLSEILSALNKPRQFMLKIKKSDSHEMKLKKRPELKSLYHHWFPNEKTNILLLDLLKPVPIELTSINFIQPIISMYNPFLTYFIKNLLELVEPQLDKYVVQKICELAKLISCPENFPALTSRIYTVDDLKLDNEGQMESIDDCESDYEMSEKPMETNIGDQDSANLNKSIWRLASSEHSWSTCPIGRLPWQSDNVEQCE